MGEFGPMDFEPTGFEPGFDASPDVRFEPGFESVPDVGFEEYTPTEEYATVEDFSPMEEAAPVESLPVDFSPPEMTAPESEQPVDIQEMVEQEVEPPRVFEEAQVPEPILVDDLDTDNFRSEIEDAQPVPIEILSDEPVYGLDQAPETVDPLYEQPEMVGPELLEPDVEDLVTYPTPEMPIEPTVEIEVPTDTDLYQYPEIPDFAPTDLLIEDPENLPEIAPSEISDIEPDPLPDALPSDIPNDLPVEIPDAVPSDGSDDLPDYIPSEISDTIPSEIPSELPSDIPGDMPADIPGIFPSDSPDAIPSDSPYEVPADDHSEEPDYTDLPLDPIPAFSDNGEPGKDQRETDSLLEAPDKPSDWSYKPEEFPQEEAYIDIEDSEQNQQVISPEYEQYRQQEQLPEIEPGFGPKPTWDGAPEEPADQPSDQPEVPPIDQPIDQPADEPNSTTPPEAPNEAATEQSTEVPEATEQAAEDGDDEGQDFVHIDKEEEVFLDELESNTLYEKNGYLYETDDQGRPIHAYGDLILEPGERTRQQTEIGHQGDEDDEGGHIFGTRFDGPPDAFNIVPQNWELNRGEYKAMEDEWAAALEEGSMVDVSVELEYEDDSIRPSVYNVTYWIDGVAYEKAFENKAPLK